MTPLVTEEDAAILLNVSTRTLQRWRVTGLGPKFVKAGHSVRYSEQSLSAWVASHTVGSTSQLTETIDE
jgi:hypothetical protein